jgi:hypothetical protein
VVAEPGVEVRVQDLGDLSATTVDEVRGLAVRRQWRRLGCGWRAGGVEGAGPSREWRRRRILMEKENRAGRRRNEEYG